MFTYFFWIVAISIVIVQGYTVTPMYVQINVPVTLTCPADDQATNLTWTGPGGHLWVTGTTVEDGVNDGSIPRISAGHLGGNYTLTINTFRSRDTGIYTCTVNEAVRQLMIRGGEMLVNVGFSGRGSTAKLPCRYNGGSAEWSVTSPTEFLYTSGSDINPNLPESTRTRINVVWEDSNYDLQITDVQLSDIREYRCVFGYKNIFYHLLLYITPRFPEVENTVMLDGQNITMGAEDANLTLTCNAQGGAPSSTVSWIRDNTTLVTWGTRAKYTKVFTRNDDKSLYICQSSSPALSSPQTTSVLVYLDLKPDIPHLSSNSSPVENTDIQTFCESVGSRPAVDIEWNVGGTWLSINPGEVKVLNNSTDTYTVTSSLSRRVTRQDNGKSVYCRVSNQALSGGIESVRRTITVLFGPDSVNISGNRVVVADGTNTLTLTCTTQEYNRHVHITWYNGTTRIPNTAVVTNTSGSYGGFISTQVLQLVPDMYQGGNVVRCVVQNEDVTLGERPASVTLDINYGPYLKLVAIPGKKVKEGVNIEITCNVDSNPAPLSIAWSRLGGQLPVDANVTSGLLRIPSTRQVDAGTYLCTAVNLIGIGQAVIHIEINSKFPYETIFHSTTNPRNNSVNGVINLLRFY